MRPFTHVAMGLCLLAASTGTARAMEAMHFEGTWVGDRDGYEMVWRFDADGHLRMDGRRARWIARQDTLLVEFEPPDDKSATTEKAVYQFVGSDPELAHRRLFIYGFDLGKSGVLLTRRASDEDLARLQSAVKVGTAPAGSPSASSSAPTAREARSRPTSQR
ncbi:MAG TPA: hypothetical protein VFD07_07500 [Candidatus Krumholzibacteria bacterium]|nr:hypothetical protein [Candidatus Krumholzibacteria bacterium]